MKILESGQAAVQWVTDWFEGKGGELPKSEIDPKALLVNSDPEISRPAFNFKGAGAALVLQRVLIAHHAMSALHASHRTISRARMWECLEGLQNTATGLERVTGLTGTAGALSTVLGLFAPRIADSFLGDNPNGLAQWALDNFAANMTSTSRAEYRGSMMSAVKGLGPAASALLGQMGQTFQSKGQVHGALSQGVQDDANNTSAEGNTVRQQSQAVSGSLSDLDRKRNEVLMAILRSS